MSNLEEIKLAISSSLPGLSDETLQKCIHGLSAIGVETKDDLRYVKEWNSSWNSSGLYNATNY